MDEKIHVLCDLFPISPSDCAFQTPWWSSEPHSSSNLPYISFFLFFPLDSSCPALCGIASTSNALCQVSSWHWAGSAPQFKLLHVGHGHQLQKACSLSVPLNFIWADRELNVTKGRMVRKPSLGAQSTYTYDESVWKSHSGCFSLVISIWKGDSNAPKYVVFELYMWKL